MSNPPQDHEVHVAVDDQIQDDDAISEFGSSIASSSTSIRDSILEYRRENGRTYHRYKEGKYWGPNDEQELDRLDLVNELCFLTLDGKPGIAPPCDENTKVGRVLDVGTGTGIWAINFADEHPEAEVFGIDLSATQPQDVPPNLRFEIDDVEDDWTYSRPFDYIHSRFMTAGIRNWKLFLQRCFDNLEPGGWVELQETDIVAHSDDGTLKPDNALSKWAKYLTEACVNLGTNWVHGPDLKDIMLEVGFEDVSMTTYKWPTNSWPKEVKFKELGIWNHENFMAGIEAISMAPLTRGLGWTKEEVTVLLIDVRKEGKNRNIHAYWPQYVMIGRKPQKKADATPAPAANEA